MEIDHLRFTFSGVNYQIDPHIWNDHPNRIGLITVERIKDAVGAPDLVEHETISTKLFWKWFPELGDDGNYIKVVVKIDRDPHIVTTAYPDSNMRRRMKRGDL